MKLELCEWIILGIVFAIASWFSTTGIKSQWIRVLDVVVYGPLLIYASTQVDQTWLKVLLVFMGVTTMVYNFRNYMHQDK